VSGEKRERKSVVMRYYKNMEIEKESDIGV